MASGKSSNKSWSGTIGWVKVSYTSSWWKTTYNVWWKSYSDVKSAANAIKNSSWFSKSWPYINSKWQSFWNNSSRWSSFVDPSVLHDQYMGMSNEDIAKKWWWTDASWNSWSSTAWWTKVLQALNKNNRVYWTGWYTQYNPSTWLYSKPASSTSSSSQKDTIWQYWDASYKNYTNAYNNYKSQWMDEEAARRQAAKLLENEDLLSTKSDDIIYEEPTNDDEDFDYLNDIMNWIEEEWYEEEPYYPDYDELFWDWADRYKRRINELESQLDSNVVKTSVPEERDTSYDYNTYYKENLAPNTNYENWESKNTLNDKPQVTLVSQYQEPVTTALNDLGLLTPNEEAAQVPNVEEAVTPKQYNSGEDIVQDFVTTLDTMWQEGWTWLTPQAVAQTYVDFKNQLQEYANNNNLSKEEYDALLAQLKNNETLNTILKGNNK